MIKLQIFEPGLYPREIDLSHHWGPDDHMVTIGVAREGVSSGHIAFQNPATFLSRRQVSIMSINGDLSKLVVRDGGPEADGAWSQSWKHTYINGVELKNTEWRAFGLGDQLRFHIEKPQISEYRVRLIWNDTDNDGNAQTMSFDAVKAWTAISRASVGIGTLLLSVPRQDGIAIIIRLDAYAEMFLGADQGELKETQEKCILNNLVPVGPDETRLAKHVREAMVYPGQAFQGEYDFGAGLVNLRLENRRINGEYALLGWITPEKP